MKKIFAAILIGFAWRSVQAQGGRLAKCEAPSDSLNASVAEYAAKKYHIGSTSKLTLLDSAKANEDCYWKYHFQAASPKLDIVLYLAPDRKYLSGTLYDRTTNPLAEEELQRQQLTKTLVGTGLPSLGPDTAPVTIVEFSDFQCPFCQQLSATLEQQVLPANPDVRVIFRNYPLPMHPFARPAAQIAACAKMQSSEAFWALHDYIFTHQSEFTADNIQEELSKVADGQDGIDHKAFHDCVDRGLSVRPVMEDVELGRKLGVHVAPTFYINGSRVEGSLDAARLNELIVQAKEGTLPYPPIGDTQTSTRGDYVLPKQEIVLREGGLAWYSPHSFQPDNSVSAQTPPR
jgi:protein-disulfide isomerase